MRAMSIIRKSLQRASTDRRGVTALEYGLIAALIAVGIVGAVTKVGVGLASTFNLLAAKL